MSERTEALFRIIIFIISGIILGLWKALVDIINVFHWIYVLISGKRSRTIAKFNNLWVTFSYKYYRYIYFTTNKRVFPFVELGKNVESVDMRKKK